MAAEATHDLDDALGAINDSDSDDDDGAPQKAEGEGMGRRDTAAYNVSPVRHARGSLALTPSRSFGCRSLGCSC